MRFIMLVGAIVATIAIGVRVHASTLPDLQCVSSPTSCEVTTLPVESLLPGPLKDTADYLTRTGDELTAEWSDWFSSSGLQQPSVIYTIVRPGDIATSKCQLQGDDQRIFTDANNAFYCRDDSAKGSDGKTVHGPRIILPLATFSRIRDGIVMGIPVTPESMFGMAVVVAHEYGHAVHDAIASQRGVDGPSRAQNEQLADCFAGNWAQAENTDGKLQSGDMDIAMATMRAIGDNNFHGENHHGTSQERGAAFELGLQSTPVQCMRVYWPEITSRL